MEHTNETREGKFIVRTYQDNDPINPRENDNFGTMICFHGRYNLGDKHDYNHNDYNGWEEMKKAIMKKEKVGVILPLYLYDHSGITISTSPFSCNWDSGQIGFIFCTKEQMKESWIKQSGQEPSERCEVLLKGEVESYDKYLRGEQYGYKVFEVETCDKGHEHEEELESGWGYDDEDECMNEGLSLVGYYKNKELVS